MNAPASAESVSRRPTLSVAIANYNHARYLPQAIEAIAAQSRPADEFIIVDDASTDHSRDVIREYALRIPYLRPIFRERNGGFNAAITDALQAASGAYFYPASADDFVLPGFFAGAMALVEQYPGVGIAFGDVETHFADGRIERQGMSRWRTARHASPRDCLHEFLAVEAPTFSLSPATVFRRDSALAIGGYRAEARSFSDTLLIWCVAAQHGGAYWPHPCAAFRLQPQGFGQSTTRHFPTQISIIENTARLLRTEFRALFPPHLAARWRKAALRTAIDRHLDLVTPYQGTLRLDDVARSVPGFPWREWLYLSRKAASAGVKFYQWVVRRAVLHALLNSNEEQREALIERLMTSL